VVEDAEIESYSILNKFKTGTFLPKLYKQVYYITAITLDAALLMNKLTVM